MKKYNLPRLVLFIALSFILAGCSSSPPPQTVVQNFLNAIQAGDLETAAVYVISEGEEFNQELMEQTEKSEEEILKKVFSQISYEIKSHAIEGEKATVDTTIVSLDFIRIITKTMTELMPMAFASAFSDQDQEDMDALMEQYLINSISDPNAPKTTNEVKIHLKKVNGQWLIEPNDDLINGLTGNITKALESF